MNNIGRSPELVNAVFEGGGVKGIGLAGALIEAEKHCQWGFVAGTSAGAVIASLVAAGYRAEEIADLVLSFAYERMADTSYGHFPLVGPLWRLWLNLGLYKGKYLEDWIREKLLAKGICRFGDLAMPDLASSSDDRYRLRVIASDISTGSMLVLPQDIARYGIDPDHLDIARAVRMSMSIPLYFEPVALNYRDDKGQAQKSYIVDGGMLSNYPVWLFDRNNILPQALTIGFKLVGPTEDRPHKINGPISLLGAVLETMMEAHDNRYIEQKNFARTIAIPTLDIRATDWRLSRRQIRELFNSGVKAATGFFHEWEWRKRLCRA